MRREFWAGALVLTIWMGATGRVAVADEEAAKQALAETLMWLDTGQVDRALEGVRRAIREDPASVEAHMLYIRLMTQLNRRDEVERAYRSQRDADPSALNTLLYARTLGDLDKMVSVALEALKIDPGFGWAYFSIATVRVQQNKMDEAAEALEEAIRVQPDFVQAHQSLGSLYISIGKTDEALRIYARALELAPDDAQVLFQYGSILGKKGRLEEGTKLLEKSHALAPDNVQVMTNLGFLYLKLKRYDEAIAMYDRVLAMVPKHPTARVTREIVQRVMNGQVKYETVALMEQAMDAESPEEAIAHYRRVIELNPTFELPYLALAQLLAGTDRHEDAEKAFLYALELNPKSVEAARMISEFYLVAGTPNKAEPFLAKALEGSPNSPELYAALGLVYANANKPDRSEQAFRKTVELLPAQAGLTARFSLARAMIAQGKYVAGAAELRQCLKIQPQMVEALVELSAAYFIMEDFERARDAGLEAQKLVPGNDQIEALLKGINEREAAYALKAKDHLRAKQILVKSSEDAAQVLAALKAGASFEMVARQRSIGPEAADGGDIGFFKKGELLPEFEAAVLALEPGEISGVVQSSRGFQVIKRIN